MRIDRSSLVVALLGSALLSFVAANTARGQSGGWPPLPGVNQPPVATIVAPADGAWFVAPAEIVVAADASDVDGTVAKLELVVDGKTVSLAASGPLDPSGSSSHFRLVWSGVPPGEYTLTAKATDNLGATGTSAPVRIRVLDPALVPVVNLRASDPVATEQSPLTDAPTDTASFVVSRTGPLANPLTVRYAVAGSAQNGVDYAKLTGEVVIPPEHESATIVVDPLDDTWVEGDETVVIELRPPLLDPTLPPTAAYVLGTARRASAVIKDNDTAPPPTPAVRIFSPPDGAILVNPATVTIVAGVTDPAGIVQAVEFFVDDQSLGVVPLAPVVLENGESSQPVHPEWGLVTLVQITWAEPTPGLHQLTAAARAETGVAAVSAPVHVRILDAAPAPVVTVLASDPLGAEGPLPTGTSAEPDPVRFTIHRTGSTAGELRVYFELAGCAVNGVDYKELPTSATILAGTSTAEVIVFPIDDTLVEGREEVVLRLLPPPMTGMEPTDGAYWVGRPAIATGVILDNDTPENLPPEVRLRHPLDGEVFLAPASIALVAAAADRDGTVKSVEFFANDRSLGIVTEPVADPTLPPSPGAIYSLKWADVAAGEYTLTAVATDDDGAATTSPPVRIKVVQLQPPPVVTVVATDPEAAEPVISPDGTRPPLNTATFSIRRTGPTTDPLTVYYCLGGTALNGVDYEELPQKLTIAAGAESAELEVNPLHDELPEGTETVVLRLVPTVCRDNVLPSPLPYTVGEPGWAKAVILDNDPAENLPPRVGIARPVDGQIFVAPVDIEVKVFALDPDGWVPKVEFYDGETKIGEAIIVFIRPPPPGELQTFTFKWENVAPGRHELRAKAIDDRGASTWSPPVHLVVLNAQLLPMVTVRATDPLAAETGLLTVIDPAIFTVHRTGDLTDPLKIRYRMEGNAENGVDYLRLSGEVEIAAGKATADVEVIPYNDELVEGVENVVLVLEPPLIPVTDPPAPGAYMVGIPGRAAAVIRDPDLPPTLPPQLEIVRPHAGEVFQAPAEITIVVQAKDPDGWVRLVEFYANDRKIGEQSMEFFRAPDPGELQTFSFTWTGVPAGTYLLWARATDDRGLTGVSVRVPISVFGALEPPVVRIFATDPLASERTLDGRVNTAAFRVYRTGNTSQSLVVFYTIEGTAENGKDYVEIPNHVEIPAGSVSARITITPLPDNLGERVETVRLRLAPSPSMSPIEPYRIGVPACAVAIIVDEPPPVPAFQKLPDGAYHVRLPAVDGQAYRLEMSTNLIDWLPLGEGFASDAVLQYIEPECTQHAQRFYRIRPVVPLAVEVGN